MKRAVSTLMLCALLLSSAPSVASAYPFGGRTSLVIPCVFSFSILAMLGSPNPGLYMWTPFTKTYPNGPPKLGGGQWILGMTGVPYICVVFPVGPIIIPGTTISMMGSS